MWIHSIVNVGYTLFTLVLFSVVISWFFWGSPRFFFFFFLCIFFFGGGPLFFFFFFSVLFLRIVDFVNLRRQHTEADLMCPSSFRTSSKCPRVWTAITANDGQLFSHEDDGASPHPHGQKLRHPNKKMWCNESHVVGAPKKSKRRKPPPRPYARIYTPSDSANPHRRQPQKTPNSMRHPSIPLPPIQ